jgi:hypothetical protein
MSNPDTPASSPTGRTGVPESLPSRMAEELCAGFVLHDQRDRTGAVEAFFAVDRLQFPHLSEDEAREAATAYVDSLWAKDEVEAPYIDGREVVDLDGLADADWEPVERPLRRRARIVGMSEEYARLTTLAWKRHKVGGDYWTPTLKAQRIEIDAAIGGSGHPEKNGFGADGCGHIAARYLVGVELHDMHTERHWNQAIDVMSGYFDEIVRSRR